MSMGNIVHVAVNFESVHGYASSGGVDRAYLYDSTGNDTLVQRDNYVLMRGDDFHNRAKFFDETRVRAIAGGQDRAHLHDTALDDHFAAAGNSAQWTNDVASTWLLGFEHTTAWSNAGGDDTAEVDAVDHLLQMRGDWM